MTHEVFISYSSKDKHIADAICAHIEAAGIRCWIAPRDINPGEDWPTAIADAISQGQALVLIFSAHSNSSEEVGRELFLAATNKLVIIPFKIEDVEPEPGKQFYLARTHWLDALNPPTLEQIQELVDCVKSLLPFRPPAISFTPPPTPAPSPVPPSPESRALKIRKVSPLLWALPLGIIVIILLFLPVVFLFSNRLMAIFRPMPTETLSVTPSPSLVSTRTPTQLPTAYPTMEPTLPPVPTISSAAFDAISFSKVYISEPFNDNSLEWPVGDIVGPWWLGKRAIENGIINWDGTSEQAMSSHVGPEVSDKLAFLSDEQVSVKAKLVNQDMWGGYGLFIRSNSEESAFYDYSVSQGQFSFQGLLPDGTWKMILDWQASPYITSEGWNTMKIQAVGSHFRLFFNNHLIGEADDASLQSGLSGIVVHAYDTDVQIQMQFDDFEVTLPYP